MANIPISSFTAAANATGIGMSGFSLTGSNAQSMLDLAGTWNTSGTPTGLKLNVTDTASNAASLLMDLQTGGTSRFRVAKDGGFVQSGSGVNWHYITTASNELSIQGNAVNNGVAITNNGVRACSANPTFSFSTTVLGAADLILTRDAANTLAQRNGVNAQTFRVYNTFTDASNYERGFMRWAANVLEIGTERAGTGQNRDIWIYAGGGVGLIMTPAANLFYRAPLPLSDNGMSIGTTSQAWTNIFSAGYSEMREMTAPAAPVTDRVRIYAEDNGAGKTRLMARFATGAAVQIAIEP